MTETIIDPTELTTQMVLREVNILDDKLTDATVVRHNDQKALKELLTSKLKDASSVRDEKFRAVNDKFRSIENLRIEQKGDSKIGLDAALAAQKEAAIEQNKSNTLAISKSEAATSETINKLAELFKTTTDGIIGQINDIKDRITKTEGIKTGGQETTTNNRANITLIISGVLFLLTIAGIIITFGK